MRNGKVRDRQMMRVVSEEFDLILASAADQRLGELGVTQVICSPGGGSFTIYVAPVEESQAFSCAEEIRQMLSQAIGYLRTELSAALRVKRSPQISVGVDPVYLLGRWGR